MAFHQTAANEVGGYQLGRADEKGLGQGWELLGDGSGGYKRDWNRDLVPRYQLAKLAQTMKFIRTSLITAGSLTLFATDAKSDG